MNGAYYNENDAFAAEWLRHLIAAGHIAPGDVDTRSIIDVRPSDLAGYSECHFFAGIGIWSYALRNAGWTRPVWTGSCPCGPFSGAGRKEGFADERHLWPAFYHLISQCRPNIVLGEQVASQHGLAWLDLVQSDMEGAGYACGALDLCAAGFGAPHIRQRLYWMAHAEGESSGAGFCDCRPARVGRLEPTDGSTARLMVNDQRARLEGHAWHGHGETGWALPAGPASASGSSHQNGPTGPVNGFWRDADWLLCRDGKWRAVESGTFPLAHGVTERVGRLRGYGNAIVAQTAQAFIEAVMEYLP